MAENKRGHLRVPETGLVSEMNARIEHFTHCYCHDIFQLNQKVRSKTSPICHSEVYISIETALRNTLNGRVCE
jgi:hypothetical protein